MDREDAGGVQYGTSARHPDSLPGPTLEERAAGRLMGKDLQPGTKVWVKHWLSFPPVGVYCWLPGFVVDASMFGDDGLVGVRIAVRRDPTLAVPEMTVEKYPIPLRFTGPEDLEEARRLPIELPERHSEGE